MKDLKAEILSMTFLYSLSLLLATVFVGEHIAVFVFGIFLGFFLAAAYFSVDEALDRKIKFTFREKVAAVLMIAAIVVYLLVFSLFPRAFWPWLFGLALSMGMLLLAAWVGEIDAGC